MNAATLLHRQVHPNFIHSGRISSQVFEPTRKDGTLLSVYDGDQFTAKTSWRHYTSEPHCKSVGVVSVTVDECSRDDLPTIADADTFPGHVLIDFSELTKSAVKRAAKRLRAAAEQRGWQYRAEDSS